MKVSTLRKPRSTLNWGHQAKEETLGRDSDQKMHAAYPEALNQGMTDLGHLEGKIRKEKLCSEGWKRVYFSGWVIKKMVSSQVDPLMDEPRRNAGRTFKVAHQNLLTTRTMDDEDAPGLKALLTFKLVALDNSVEGMEVVCQEFEATSKDPEGHSVDELITEFSSSCLSAKVSKTFHIIPSSKSCEYVLNTLMQVIRPVAVFLRFQVIVLQLEFLMLKDNEAKVLNVSDAIEENNAFDATSSHLTELEANEVVNDGDMELLTDVESTSGIDARDQDSELVLVDGKQDDAEVVGVADEQNSNEADVLENNGVIGVGVNENNEGSKGILEDVPEVNKKVAHVIIENSENGVSSDADLDETVIHIHVNGDSVDHRTQPDDEISGEKVEQNEEVVPKHFKPSSSAIHETEVERQPSFDDKVSESVADSSEIREQKDEDKPLNKEPESRPVIGVSLSTAKSVAPTPTAVPNLKDDPKPKETPTPNSRPNTPPTLRPFLAPVLTRPAGIGRSAPLLEPAHRVAQSKANGNVSPPQNQVIDEPTNGEAEENDETREKLQMIRVKFLRLARRLGQTHNVVVAQVLYRLGLVKQLRGRTGGRVAAFSFERANAMAEQLEAAGQEPLEFSCTIMVLGKMGVGKSATINSIFDEGIKVRVIDTPGLLPFWADQRKNQKTLQSVKKFIQKSPPDIVLYLDRLDMQSRDDIPLLRTITDIFGQSIWFNAIVVLTHAASAPPEGPNGTATSYDMFVTQRTHVVQQAIRQAAGDMRLMNPVSLVENHSVCRTNRNGQRVLPNAARLATWKAVCSQKSSTTFTLHSVNSFGDDNDDALDDDIDESSDEETSEYDEFPPFKRLTNAHVSKLSKEEKKSYYDELEYREKLFMKKQLKEEKKRRKMMKKMAEAAKIFPTELTDNNVEEDSNAAATVPVAVVAVQDMTLPASFDADNHTHRYRVLDSANQWLIRPVLDPHGWDHDVGYEGINVEHLLALKEKITVSFSGQVTKDKKDANLQMEVSSAMKHGKSKSTTVAFDMQTFGKEMSYSLRSETRFISYRKNKASAGLSATYFGDTLTGGVKFEDKLMINKRGELVVAEGAVIAVVMWPYGGSLEATLRDKDFPLCRFLSTIGYGLAWRSCTWVECSVPNSYWPSPPSNESFATRNMKFSNLVVKCLIKLTKDLQSTIDEVDLDHILQIIHVYLQELGIDEIRRRVGAIANDLHMVKTVLYELVKLRGTAIKGHLSMVPIDMETQHEMNDN
ncbi:translocase of chloroplast 120, chloroplastic-like protein [Tanacetum coccineum]|uniref:Translocase of chloroplast 120, chloroplastic-like protein n=1 Tax=Tanacetum coccineum TaxID=301880 RepID=A0ABQ4XI24_9ASTR